MTQGFTMRKTASRIVGALSVVLMVCAATAAHAVQYPPGPTPLVCSPCPACGDTLVRIEYVQNNTGSICPHPVDPDTVWGLGGIIIGFDEIPSGFSVYIENRPGNAFGGVDVFTGGTNYRLLPQFSGNLQLGDSVMVYGRLGEFAGGTELRGFSSGSPFNDPKPGMRRISTGNSLPPFHVGTVAQLQWLNTNTSAEQWEGMLVRASRSGATTHKLRVARNVGVVNPEDGGSTNFLAVDNVVCPPGFGSPCDSLMVDGATHTTLTPPPLGALVDSVQGIYEQRGLGYRVMLRDANDIFDSQPPHFVDAYMISADSVECIFDRNLRAGEANNALNYTVGSTASPADAAIRQVTHSIVHLKITSSAGVGNLENITAQNLVNEQNNIAMSGSELREFYDGIVPIATIRAPLGSALLATPCEDRSKYSGAGNNNGGKRITTRGVALASVGSDTWFQTQAGGVRSGADVFAPKSPLIAGHQYVFAGAVSEFFGETELTDNAYLKDEGAVTPPTAVVQTIHVLRDTTCDVNQNITNGKDFESQLVRITDAKTLAEHPAGESFSVAGPYPSNPDTILIRHGTPWTFDPTKNQYVSVTGALELNFSVYRIQPRDNSDFTINTTLGVDDQTPGEVSFSISPNPARTFKLTFALPKRDRVNIGVYDLAGRRLATLADAEFPAGPHTLDWDGRDNNGHVVGSGVYFYKLKVGTQTFARRGVLLN